MTMCVILYKFYVFYIFNDIFNKNEYFDNMIGISS